MNSIGTGMAVAHEAIVRHSFTLLEAARIYHAVWQDESVRYVDAVALLNRHAGYPGFAGLLARDANGQAVAMAYGHTTRPGQWWHDRVQPVMPAACATWLDDCFVLVELAVLPDHRRRGVGRGLVEHLLRDRPEARAALSIQEANGPARSFYGTLGWEPIAGPIRFAPAGSPYVILGCELRGP